MADGNNGTGRKTRKDKFSRLDIVDDHELQIRNTSTNLDGRCTCGQFRTSAGLAARDYEHVTDAWLKHVQHVRDQMRGHVHV